MQREPHKESCLWPRRVVRRGICGCKNAAKNCEPRTAKYWTEQVEFWRNGTTTSSRFERKRGAVAINRETQHTLRWAVLVHSRHSWAPGRGENENINLLTTSVTRPLPSKNISPGLERSELALVRSETQLTPRWSSLRPLAPPLLIGAWESAFLPMLPIAQSRPENHPQSQNTPLGVECFGFGDRVNSTVQHPEPNALDQMSGLAYSTGESMLTALGSPSDSAGNFLRDVSGMTGTMPSPFLSDTNGINVGGGAADSAYLGNDPMEEASVKREIDMEQALAVRHFGQINPDSQVLQGTCLVSPHPSTDSEQSVVCPDHELGHNIRKRASGNACEQIDLGQFPGMRTHLYTAVDDGLHASAKRLCMPDLGQPLRQSGARFAPANVQLVRTESHPSPAWAVHSVANQSGLQSMQQIPGGHAQAALMYNQGMISPVTRRHSTGSSGYVLSPASSQSAHGPVMYPVHEHGLPVNHQVMTQGTFRINSAPIPYKSRESLTPYDGHGLGPPDPRCMQREGLRGQVIREGAEDGRPKRRVHKKRENLPKESTALLKDWLLSHMMLPYPGNEEKIQLCKATNLDISQINNWFINARVRIWKPLVQRVFEKNSERLMQQAKDDNDEHQVKRIQDAHKTSTMNMITLLSVLPTARKELDEIANKSKSLSKEM
ncbi:hypothetical protein BSKO_00160 [Bryopsis sp. KO-2023]|nr:hypothetical protein BSKO_00160 [Bryopsis sp. KO-2023]